MGCDVAWERVGFALVDMIAIIVGASVAFLARRKRIARADGAAAGPETMAAADEVAWSCLHSTMAFSTVAPVSNADVWGAFALRPKRADFEDGLIVAAAERCRAAALVTQDQPLSRRTAPSPAWASTRRRRR